MNWSVIILGLVALSSVAIAENSYLVIVPKLLKVGYDNQFSVFIAAASQPVQVKFELTVGQQHVQNTTTVNPGTTQNVTLTLPSEFPVGAGELSIVGTGGVTFEENRDIIVYDNSYVVLVQTSASTYRPGDTMDIRVVVTNEELVPVGDGEVLVEIYDSNLKLVGEFQNLTIHNGLIDTFTFPIASHCNVGTWLVSATVKNTTSSIQVLVAKPITPSFDLKAIFQRFLLRTEKTLRGFIEIDDDDNEPIFGRCLIAVGPITEQDVQIMMQQQNQKQQSVPPTPEVWRKWKSQQFEVAGRIEINYDLLSTFNVDVTKAIALQVYIQVTDLASGQERFIQHVIPIFTRDVVYDIRPLEFQAGVQNEFEVICKRPDGKPAKMEDLIVTVTMMTGNGQGKVQGEKTVEIKEFYTRGRNDIGLFHIEIPENVIGVLMTITPLSEDGKVRGYRTHAIPLMPTPRSVASGCKLSVELLPSTTNWVPNDASSQVVSSQISTVGRTSNFYVQLIPSKSLEKYEPLPVSYVLLTNGRIILTGQFTIQPTKECTSKTQRSIQPEGSVPPVCVFNGTLPIQITRAMMPYSTLLVYTLQPSWGIHVAESYRFAVAGLFQTPLTLNATTVPFTPTSTVPYDEHADYGHDYDVSEGVDLNSVSISNRAQCKSRVELSFTGTPGSTVGLNVIEYDGVIHGLQTDITKERLLQYLTTYEHVPIVGMPTSTSSSGEQVGVHTRNVELEDESEGGFSTTTEVYNQGSTSSYNKRGTGMPENTEYNVNGQQSGNVNTNQPLTRKNAVRRPPSNGMVNNPLNGMNPRAVVSEGEEEQNILREHTGFKIRYPIEKMVFGVSTSRGLLPIEGDDPYTTSNLGRLFGDKPSQQSLYRRRAFKSSSQYDVTVEDNDYVITTSYPMVMKVAAGSQHPPVQSGQQFQGQDDVEANQQGETQNPQYGTSLWYEKMYSKLNVISQEAFKFMQSGLSVVTDFPSLHVPVDVRRTNLTNLFSRFRQSLTYLDPQSFDIRDEARQLLEEYIIESDLTMVPPPILFEEQARVGYYNSIYFNTTTIPSQGTGKVVIPQTKPYSTWLATGFALSPKSGLSIAQPIRLPTNPGLFILANFPSEVQIGEHVLLTYGINNYLGRDLNNVVVRIRASADFDLIEQTQSDRVVSSNGKDYTITIPSLKSLGVETRNIVLVPKRAGVVKIILEVESEWGGDYEVLTAHVCESGIKRKQISAQLYDLTNEKKTYGPIVEKITPSPFLRSVKLAVSGTGLDRLVKRYTLETSTLIGVDHAIIRLWRLLGLRRYLNETSQVETPLFNATTGNISTAYQKLLLYNDYNGSFSFISDQGEQQSSLYLTSLAFGALISPLMPVHDNVTINRTLNWILSLQQSDGSFDDQGPCFHYTFCTGEFRRESLTALVLYAMTHNNVSQYVPEFVRSQLYHGEQSPVVLAQRYLESRLDAVKPCLLTTTLIELALIQCQYLPAQLKQKIYQNVRSRQLTVVPEDGSKYLKVPNEKYTIDDQLLLNALTLSIYVTYGDFQTTSCIARWIVGQIETHPHYDTVLDAVFRTQAWLMTDCLFRRRFGSEKMSVVVDVTADNGQKQQLKIDSSNMDITQKLNFTLPVNQITYTVSGFGIVGVCIKQVYVEKQQQQQTGQQIPFQLTNEFTPMPWLSEISARTCVTYTPTAQNQQLVKDNNNFNRTIIVAVQLPSGFRLNLRQIGFFLSQVPEVVYFTMNEHLNTINFFLNVPSTVYGKQICFPWCLERLSVVTSWAPIQIRVYDYLQQETQLVRLFPVQFQPNLLGYSFVDAVHKNRPTIEQLAQMHKQQQPLHV
jgi:hypothetical protein